MRPLFECGPYWRHYGTYVVLYMTNLSYYYLRLQSTTCYFFGFQAEEGNILGQTSDNSFVITYVNTIWPTFFTLVKVSLIHKIFRYPQKCNFFSRLDRQLTCSTGIVGKHSRTKGQKNHVLSSDLENSPQLWMNSLTSLTLI